MSEKRPIPAGQWTPATPAWGDLIEAHSEPSDVILVPFASDAAIARAALERDRRVILFVRTAAQRLRLRGSLMPPDEAARRRALAQLAATTKRDTPLDVYINSLYETDCPNCGETVPASAFIWDPDRGAPVEKELVCSACGFQGRAPADHADVRRAGQFERRGLSFWFILEWLVDAQDTSGREIARRHLDDYTPRNLTALADITRKIDAELSDDPASQRVLRLRLLHALDAGRLLPEPPSRADLHLVEDPTGRRTDSGYLIERNVWQVLAEPPPAESVDGPVRITAELEAFFGNAVPVPNVALAVGPVRRLAQQLPPASAALMLGEPPTLAADAWVWEHLWSRWVYGRGTAGGLQPPIGGWARHVRALGATVQALVPALQTDGRAIFQFEDSDSDRALALLAGMATCATLDGFLYQPRLVTPTNLFDAAGGVYHLVFTRDMATSDSPASTPADLADAVERAAVDAARDVIGIRGEPLSYGWLVAAAMARLARAGLLGQAMAGLDADTSPLAFAKQHVRQGLRSALSGGRLVAAAGDTPTHWWLPEPPPAEPLIERVECTVIDLLDRVPTVSPADVYRAYPGWLTPELGVVETLLSAYGDEIEPGVWDQQPSDESKRQMAEQAARRLGQRLGFSVGASLADVVWGEGGHATHAFRFVKTGQWRDLDIDELPDGVAGYFIVTERLGDLFRVKLLRNPLYRRELAAAGWRFIKARHLLAMADDAEVVDRQGFKKIVGLDPIIEQAEAQIPLF